MTKVVNFDWLEDSLLSATERPKNTKPYEWEQISRTKEEKEHMQKVKKTEKIQKKRMSRVALHMDAIANNHSSSRIHEPRY